jgi:hypothetical protein
MVGWHKARKLIHHYSDTGLPYKRMSRKALYRAYLQSSSAAATDLLNDAPAQGGVGVGAPFGLPRQTVMRPPSLTRGRSEKSGRPVSGKPEAANEQ